MGKKLIIKGVDYSANAISNEPVTPTPEWQEIELEQGSMTAGGTMPGSSSQYPLHEDTEQRRVRTKNFVKVSGNFTIKLEPEMAFNVFFYKTAAFSLDKQIGKWVSGANYSDSYEGYIRFGIRKYIDSDSTNITPADVKAYIKQG